MDRSIIIILGIILLVLIILNHITIVKTTSSTTSSTNNTKASCAQTAFGCCPDGVNSKINFYGTNCPGYRPGPGYQVTQPQVTQIVGGCAGTRYGCCPPPNITRPKLDQQGSNCLLK